MFSVIIPLYNKSKHVKKCILSVLNQTFLNFELIIVDDESKDNSLEVARFFLDQLKSKVDGNKSDKNFVPDVKIYTQKHSGVSTARNNGVKSAKNDYIAFLDADDWWEPTYLEEMKNLIEKYPEAGIYGCGYYLYKNCKKRVAPIGVDSNFSDGSINYFRVYGKKLCMPLWTGATIIKRHIFKQENGFKSGIKLGEDLDLWIRIALKHPVVLLNKPLAIYNQDVELSLRAVGVLHKTEHHVLWNLGYLKDEELKNHDLKNLMDKLRLYALYPYYLNRKTRKDARKELDKVDWASQPEILTRKYKYPLFLMLFIHRFFQMSSSIKSLFLKNCINHKSTLLRVFDP